MAAEKLTPQGLLMPMATAVWLIENTALDFKQIAGFTGLPEVQIEAIADEEVGRGIVGRNPVENGETTQEELDKAAADSSYIMVLAKKRSDIPAVKIRSKGPKYTPVSKRGDKPDAVAYLIKHNPEISDAQICKLVGTTKPTIMAIRERTHANIQSVKPRHPVDLGLCTYAELEAASAKGYRAQGKDPEEMKAQKLREQQASQEMAAAEQESSRADNMMSGFDFSNFLSSSSTPKTDDDNA